MDLSGLKNVGFYPSPMVAAFREQLLSGLESMPSLVSLDVSTIRRPQHQGGRGDGERTGQRRRQGGGGKKKKGGGGKPTGNMLPSVGDEHLRVLGQHCHQLEELNVSHNDVSGRGLMWLVPRVAEGGGEAGCPELREVHLFECPVGYKELAEVAVGLAGSLTFLGFKETGKMLKFIHNARTGFSEKRDADVSDKEDKGDSETGEGAADEKVPSPPKVPHLERSATEVTAPPLLKLTHVNNMGSKYRKLVAEGLRCKRPMSLAIAAVAPGVANLKVRVSDNDVEHLSALENLRTVELLFNHGNPANCQGPKTEAFLRVRGELLTSVAIISPSSSLGGMQVLCTLYNEHITDGSDQ